METVDNSFVCGSGSLVNNQVRIQYSTATGKCGRSNQEDRIAVNNKSDFLFSLGVFDGHGGDETAEILADQTDGLLNALHNNPLLNQKTIKKVYTEYDKKIKDSKKTLKSGSTAVTCTVDVMRKQLFLAHCGDSIGVLIQDKNILYSTIPHDTHIKTEYNRIYDTGGFIADERVNGKLNLTRSFGDYGMCKKSEEKNPKLIISDPEVFENTLQQEKSVVGLLCSDGFTDYFCSGMENLNSKNIEKKILLPLKDIICKLIQCGRPISGLAFDLVCLMNWNKSVDKILNSIDINMDWDSIKNESSSWKSYDNVSVVVFEVSDSQDNTSEVLHPQQSLTVNDHSANSIIQFPPDIHSEKNMIGCFKLQSFKQNNLFPGFTLEYQSMTNNGQDCVASKITYQENKQQWSCGIFDSHGVDSQVSQALADNQEGLLVKLSKQDNLDTQNIKRVYNDFDAGLANCIDQGSTAVTCTFDPTQKKLFLAHCGDSLCLLMNGKKMRFLNPHNCTDIVELQDVKKRGGIVSQNGNVVKVVHKFDNNQWSQLSVTRSFGDYRFLNTEHQKVIISEPEVFEIEVESEPIIGILCSDGFSDYFFKDSCTLKPKDIEEEFYKPFSLIVQTLIEDGRIETLASDLVCLIGKYSQTDLQKAIKNKEIDWQNLKIEMKNKNKSDYLDDVSLIVFKISPDNKDSHENGNSVINNMTVQNFEGGDQNSDRNDSIIQNNSKTTDDISKDSKSPSSTITKIFNYAKSFISFKHICLGTFGFFLTAYILKQLYRFKNA